MVKELEIHKCLGVEKRMSGFYPGTVSKELTKSCKNTEMIDSTNLPEGNANDLQEAKTGEGSMQETSILEVNKQESCRHELHTQDMSTQEFYMQVTSAMERYTNETAAIEIHTKETNSQGMPETHDVQEVCLKEHLAHKSNTHETHKKVDTQEMATQDKIMHDIQIEGMQADESPVQIMYAQETFTQDLPMQKQLSMENTLGYRSTKSKQDTGVKTFEYEESKDIGGHEFEMENDSARIFKYEASKDIRGHGLEIENDNTRMLLIEKEQNLKLMKDNEALKKSLDEKNCSLEMVEKLQNELESKITQFEYLYQKNENLMSELDNERKNKDQIQKQFENIELELNSKLSEITTLSLEIVHLKEEILQLTDKLFKVKENEILLETTKLSIVKEKEENHKNYEKEISTLKELLIEQENNSKSLKDRVQVLELKLMEGERDGEYKLLSLKNEFQEAEENGAKEFQNHEKIVKKLEKDLYNERIESKKYGQQLEDSEAKILNLEETKLKLEDQVAQSLFSADSSRQLLDINILIRSKEEELCQIKEVVCVNEGKLTELLENHKSENETLIRNCQEQENEYAISIKEKEESIDILEQKLFNAESSLNYSENNLISLRKDLDNMQFDKSNTLKEFLFKEAEMKTIEEEVKNLTRQLDTSQKKLVAQQNCFDATLASLNAEQENLARESLKVYTGVNPGVNPGVCSFINNFVELSNQDQYLFDPLTHNLLVNRKLTNQTNGEFGLTF